MRYECMGSESKDKNISFEEYLDRIKPYYKIIKLKENEEFI